MVNPDEVVAIWAAVREQSSLAAKDVLCSTYPLSLDRTLRL